MTSENIPEKDWYEILGASPSHSMQELRQSYQRLARLYHPDKQHADAPVEELEECVQRFIEVDQAWKILGNEETKREYDLQRREVTMSQKWPVDAQVSLEDMHWIAADQCYTYDCRCGGEYVLSKEEAEENVFLLCCNTCSLSIEIVNTS
ncbi:dnaJ homolog subfamily C member 24 [Stegostoma tigrinum]|uniref:dnaJ homolog subfamily C member 24 n=1 Tax=Stegostoma tigrinum TaxID=3053191 RepID=UPI00202ADBD9|nr:dnaJ homolog subfamily C member 24 [Stegostoma tigrinum]XP_048401014.1 dnaJ homolog subfamily C member 24 [Stegostoma tigrinum]XP_048401015.1 dnaJ homolog subfamily C member 24 [Stegostoma tigrinum]XP_059508104.1 dnaJ homolog subfamily C member 24 [Stegostoma tigrinum]